MRMLGTARRGVLYVSRGTDWTSITRRESEYTPEEVVGRFLVAQPRGRSAPSTAERAIAVSEDYGRSWTTIDLDDVRPQ